MKEEGATTRIDNLISIATASIWIGILIHLLAAYGDLPDHIPTHFATDGIADRYGSKSTLIILTSIGLMVTLMMAIIPRYPRFYNIPFAVDGSKRKNVIQILNTLTKKINLCLAILFALLIGGTVQIAIGRWESLPSLGLGLMLVLIVGFLAYDTGKLWKYRQRK